MKKYGEEQAKYLLQEMGRWTDTYSHGTLIRFDFLTELKFDEEVKRICNEKGWQYREIQGDLDLLQKLVDSQWDDHSFLIVLPGQKVIASHDDKILSVE